MSAPTTILQMLHAHAARRPQQPALWSKREGRYVPTSWQEYATRVKQLALGLEALGLKPGGALPILSFNREEWLVSALGAMAMRGVPVGLYTTSSAEQLQYILSHCEAELMVVENARHLQTVLALRPQLPRLRHVIVLEPPTGALPEGVLPYAQVLERGAGADEALYDERVGSLAPDALATLIYTSGTTGFPKGVMLTHHNLVWTAERLALATGAGESTRVLSYLPLSHIAEQVMSLYMPLRVGGQVSFAESLEALAANLQEVRPTFFFGVPRVWEKLKAGVEQALRAQPPARQRLIAWARKVGAERNACAESGRPVPWTLEARYLLARRTVLGALKKKLGLDQAHFLSTGAAPVGRDVLDFFASLDLVLREVYGLSETTGPATLNVVGATRLGSLGPALTGVEVRVAEDGEVLVRGGNVCAGYYKDEAATAALLEGGWMHTGDVGEQDAEGFLHLKGRKKELIVTSGGKKTAPAHIEGLLKAVAPVGGALVHGDRRKYLVALLTVDAERARVLAREKGWPEDVRALAADERLRRHLQEAIEREVNPRLSRFEHIKRFALLAEDFSVASGELTPSLKVRRHVVEVRHQALLEALYAEGEEAGTTAAQAG